MRIVRKLILGSIFLILSLLLAVYIYAFVNRLSLDEQRKNITVYDINGDILYESNFKKTMKWTDLDDIPQFIQDSFVSVEDKRFYYHAGFDPFRMSKALITNVVYQDIRQGGSTITQQYAKNLFLTNEQTLSRKIHEFFYATRLEMQYSKADILEGYLNTIYFGHGVYGIHAASEYFFDKEMNELSISETAMLIGIPNGPSIYSPFLHEDNALERQKLILTVLKNNNTITDKQYNQAIDEKLNLSTNVNIQTYGIDEYYIDAVIAELYNQNIDLDQEIKVYTYYDSNIQIQLNNAVNTHIDFEDELEVAGIITQPFTGNIMALVGGKDYTLSQYNRAIYSSRQVASTIKPLLYYCALQQGFTPATQFTSQATTFRLSDGKEYAPTNYNDLYANDQISMINATALSDNIYAVKTHLFLGVNSLHNALLDFQIKQSQPNTSEALGTVNMSLLELSRIYNTFASEGLYIKPAFISRITNKDTTLYERDTQVKRLLQRDEILILNQMLTSTFDIQNQSYTFPSMYGHESNITIAAKSGTSDWDSLVMGFNPEYTVGIWTGFDDNRELKKQYYTISKEIFKDTFNGLYKDRPGVWYKPSDRIIEKLVDPIHGNDDPTGSLYWFLKD